MSMRAETLAEVRAERARLRAQNMVGYAMFHPRLPWDGHLYTRLQRAQDQLKAMPSESVVALVHSSGQLYWQQEGKAGGMLITPDGQRHYVQVARGPRRRILKQQASRSVAARTPRPQRWSGYRHPGYND